MPSKSVFNFINYKLNKSNFEKWHDSLRRYLIAKDYESYIDIKISVKEMNRKQIKNDNAVQTIIYNSLD